MTLKVASKRRLKRTRPSGMAAIRQIERGLSFHSLVRLGKTLDLPLERVGSLVRISARTLARRKREGRFNFDESERIFRLMSVVDDVIELFEGDIGATRRWLLRPRPIFYQQSALEFSKTEIGAGEVKDLIGRLAHGVFS